MALDRARQHGRPHLGLRGGREAHPATFYVATGTGGLFKTTNLGTTWRSVFDKQPVASIGAVAVWQKKPDVVWVGTGEANSRNSSSWGNGVYRSHDGGETLAAPRPRGDPRRSRASSCTRPTPTRSTSRPSAGCGARTPSAASSRPATAASTWQHALKVDAAPARATSCIDPSNPDVLYAAMYARRRTPWSLHRRRRRPAGSSAATDAGAPLDEARRRAAGQDRTDRARRLRARTRRSSTRWSSPTKAGTWPSSRTRAAPAACSAPTTGATAGRALSPCAPRPFYFSQIRVEPDDDQRVYLLGTDLYVLRRRRRAPSARAAPRLHPDCHAMWIDPDNARPRAARHRRRRSTPRATTGGELGLPQQPRDRRVLQPGGGHADALPRSAAGCRTTSPGAGRPPPWPSPNVEEDESDEARHHQRRLDLPRRRRRLPRRDRPDRPRHRLLRVPGRRPSAASTWRPARRKALAPRCARRAAGVPLQLEHAVPDLAARPDACCGWAATACSASTSAATSGRS